MQPLPRRGSALFAWSVTSLCAAELRVRAGNRATDGYIKKVHKVQVLSWVEKREIPRRFILKFKCENKKPFLFFFFTTLNTISKDFTLHEARKHSGCLRPVSEVLQKGRVSFSPAEKQTVNGLHHAPG